MQKLFDIACNFTSDRFDNDLDQVIQDAILNNVKKFLIVSAELGDNDKILEIKNKYTDYCYFTSGVHPHHAKNFSFDSVPILDTYISKNNPNAVGETGLDFFRNISSYDEQVFAFEEQIKLAIKHNKPLFLHQRESHEDFIYILKKYSNDLPKCVVHCFTGSKNELDDYIELDFFVGLTGWICDERRNKVLRETVKHIPLNKLMIETDCPYLIPRNLKSRGNRNEPKFLPHVAKEIARLMDVTEDSLSEITFKNSISFFK